MYNTLKQITLVHGVSGHEHRVANTLKEMIAPYCDESYIDALGNLIAFKRGYSENPKKVLLCGHMDEIGFIVNFVEDSGFIRVAPIGGDRKSVV